MSNEKAFPTTEGDKILQKDLKWQNISFTSLCCLIVYVTASTSQHAFQKGALTLHQEESSVIFDVVEIYLYHPKTIPPLALAMEN